MEYVLDMSSKYSQNHRDYRRPFGLLRYFKKDKSGVTAVEFAMIGFPFFALIFAILEVGFVFFGANALENAVDQTARLIRTGQAQTASMTKTQFKQNVCSSINVLFNCESKLKVELRSFPSFQDVANYMDNTNNDPTDANGDLRDDFVFEANTDAEEIVLLRTYLEWDITLSIPGTGLSNMQNGSRLLSTVTSFKNEPFN